jgi:hypothetical protein
MSMALRGVGVNLAGAKNVTNPGGTVYGGGNVLAARNLAILLDSKIGVSSKVSGKGNWEATMESFKGKRGILFFGGIVEENSAGRMTRGPSNVHMDLWNGSGYRSNFGFDQMFDANEIWFWELP